MPTTPARILTASILAALCQVAGLPAQGIGIEQLAALAKARHERVRPRQEAALAPFLQDFRNLDPTLAANRSYLQTRISEAAALGDAVVPLLLECLVPADDSDSARNLAKNAASVLARLDPGGFVEPLIDLARGESPTAKRRAIELLGGSGSRAAAAFLGEVLGGLRGDDRTEAVVALTRLRWPDAGAAVTALLAGADQGLAEACLDYLTRLRVTSARDAVIEALRGGHGKELLPRALRYFQRCTKDDPDAAAALLPWLGDQSGQTPERLRVRIAEALAQIAPDGHRATLDALAAVIDGGELHEFGQVAARTMLDLGEKAGRGTLFTALDKDVRRNSRVGRVMENRGDAYYRFEQWREALRDYEDAVRLTPKYSSVIRESLQEKMALCQVRLRQWRRAVQTLRDASVDRDDLVRLAAGDPAFAEAIANQRDLKQFAESLAR